MPLSRDINLWSDYNTDWMCHFSSVASLQELHSNWNNLRTIQSALLFLVKNILLKLIQAEAKKQPHTTTRHSECAFSLFATSALKHRNVPRLTQALSQFLHWATFVINIPVFYVGNKPSLVRSSDKVVAWNHLCAFAFLHCCYIIIMNHRWNTSCAVIE